MLAEIITIGDEILIGQIVDTNSAWMAQQLNLIGVSVKQITSVSDDQNHILEALALAEKRVDLILITGGLGPTKDDITKLTLAKYFNMGFRMDEASLAEIKTIFERFNRPLLEVNIQQASVPDGCEVIVNKNGTAPCMWFERNDKIFVSLPGVPFEMMYLMESDVLPKIQKRFNLPSVIHKTILTAGIGESFLAQEIEDIENELPHYIKLAYLPKLGQLRLRLSAQGDNSTALSAEIDLFAQKIKNRIGKYFIADEDIPLEKVLLNLMEKEGLTFSTAESCTGGYIAHLVTQHPGSSTAFWGGAVSYDCSLKESILGVKHETLVAYGAVSEETATEMVKGALSRFKTDYAVAVTGVAGPGGGSEEKPVGTVWIAVANKNKTLAKRFNFSKKRLQNIEYTAISAITMLLNLLKDETKKE
jgi:nicotinamide-nucleotide amidase